MGLDMCRMYIYRNVAGKQGTCSFSVMFKQIWQRWFTLWPLSVANMFHSENVVFPLPKAGYRESVTNCGSFPYGLVWKIRFTWIYRPIMTIKLYIDKMNETWKISENDEETVALCDFPSTLSHSKQGNFAFHTTATVTVKRVTFTCSDCNMVRVGFCRALRMRAQSFTSRSKRDNMLMASVQQWGPQGGATKFAKLVGCVFL